MNLKLKSPLTVLLMFLSQDGYSKNSKDNDFSSKIAQFKATISSEFRSYNERYIEVNSSQIYVVDLIKKGTYSGEWCYYFIEPVEIVKKQDRPVELIKEELMIAQKKANECKFIEGKEVPMVLGTSFQSIEEFKMIQEEFYSLFTSEKYSNELRSNYPLDYNDIQNNKSVLMTYQGDGHVEVYIPMYPSKRLKINLEFTSKRLIVKSQVFSKGQ